MNKQTIIAGLKEYDQQEVSEYAEYVSILCKNPKNAWTTKKSDQYFVDTYKAVKRDGLVFDGKHITHQSTGVSYDYIAYKNKMFKQYPESTVDVQLVYDGDEFHFEKESGKVIYKHVIKNAFTKGDMIGGYCVIKNKRGDFLTTLTRQDIEKHKKVAKTHYIWNDWFEEMALKTIIKKACKQHFADIYQNIETIDNENYDLDIPLGITDEDREAIDNITTLEGLMDFYKKNRGKGKELDKYLSIRKKQLTEQNET